MYTSFTTAILIFFVIWYTAKKAAKAEKAEKEFQEEIASWEAYADELQEKITERDEYISKVAEDVWLVGLSLDKTNGRHGAYGKWACDINSHSPWAKDKGLYDETNPVMRCGQ